jgi:2-succinyl-5-enolpyruvyl-6-hydroxy-3-cyclohexene-1-carboxylate synthase
MILCGQMQPNEGLENVLKFLAEDTSVLVLVENTSNLIDRNFIHCIDRTLEGINESELADFAPDLLIVLGGAIVSKKIKSYLRKYVPKEIWKIGADFPFMDTYQNLTFSINVNPTSFLKEFLKTENNSFSNYRNKWKQVDYINKDKAIDFIQQQEAFSDLLANHIILDYIPENSILHLANSSVVRYAQLFDPVKTITTFCNRGTSGIDGSTSTAAGASFIQKDTCNVLITGDISFFYDSNAFFNRLKLGNLRIFLINNDGGGIFKIIPGPDTTEELNDFFVFNHGYSAEYICKAFEISYYKANSILDLENQMEDFYAFSSNNKPKLMEVFTDSTLNDTVLKHYFAALS